jgi:hypothetical protein
LEARIAEVEGETALHVDPRRAVATLTNVIELASATEESDMNILRGFRFAVCLIATLCEPRQPSAREHRIADASLFTKRCAESRLAKWNMRGNAAGADCGIPSSTRRWCSTTR